MSSTDEVACCFEQLCSKSSRAAAAVAVEGEQLVLPAIQWALVGKYDQAVDQQVRQALRWPEETSMKKRANCQSNCQSNCQFANVKLSNLNTVQLAI